MYKKGVNTMYDTKLNKGLSRQQLEKIMDKMQRHKACTQIEAKDRAKLKLTEKEKLNRFAQMGKIVRYKQIYFTWLDGFGILQTPQYRTYGATISDFYKAAYDFYGAVLVE